MAKFSLRRYDTQATVGMYCAFAAFVGLLVQAAFIYQNLSTEEWIVYYGARRQIAIVVVTLGTIGLAVIGAGLGFNSAGQRRNEKGQQSWIGFFVGALVISLACALFVFFYLRGEQA